MPRVAEMVYNARVPGEQIQLATEVVFKTVRVTERPKEKRKRMGGMSRRVRKPKGLSR